MILPVATASAANGRRGSGTPLHHRQARLGAVQRLDLVLLIQRKRQRLVRWIEIETTHVLDFGGEVRIAREVEGLHQMRLEAVRAPDSPDAAGGEPRGGGECANAPMGRVRRPTARSAALS
jgi:hypothetical protein